MKWKIGFHDDFDVRELPEAVRIEVVASARLLAEFGPELGRPRVDTLKGSKFANMKELRFNAANQAWRVAFAFDPERTGVLLAAGGKSGRSERMFYRRLVTKADRRFGEHLAQLSGRSHDATTTGSPRRTSKGGARSG